jgi:hypothetical protein
MACWSTHVSREGGDVSERTIGMALDLNNHLLETPDGLIATFLGHLLAEVVLGGLQGSILGVLRLLLSLIWDVGLCLLLQVTNSSLRTCLSSSLIGGLGLRRVSALVSGSSNVVTIEGLILVVDITSLLLDVLLRQIGDIMPSVVFRWLVDLAESLLRWLHFAGSVGSSIASHIAEKNASIVEKFAKLAIGDEKRAESLQTFNRLVAVLFGSVLVGWSTWKFGITTVNVLRVPNELLDQIALVLGQEQEFGLFDDLPQISDQLLTLIGQLVGGR